MQIDTYPFAEFKTLAERFHGYAAPGLLIGGYMVAVAKKHLPDGILFEAIVETRKCLPDAVQLLTACSTGNNWMQIHDLGRYAVSLFDKHTGEGVRVSLDMAALETWPEIRDWFLKRKPKHLQDEARLLAEIEQAGERLCRIQAVCVKKHLLIHQHMGSVGVCTQCGEAYPLNDGTLCRACQGGSPYAQIAPLGM